MPINIVSRKFWNQLRNGETFSLNTSDYTDYLLATICEKIKVETTIDIWWKSVHAPYYDIFGKSTSGGTITITRLSNSFVDDEFRVGDTIYYDAWFTPTAGVSTHYTGTGTISMILDLQMDLTSFTGTLPDTSTGNIDSMTIWGTTSLTAIIMKYNCIENNDADSFISKVDGNTISMAGNGLTGTDTTLTPQGTFKGWQDDGYIKVKTGTSGLSYKQRFIVTQEFWIAPFYLPDQYNDLQDSIAPVYLKDTASLKYIANYELRASLYNPNISHSGVDSVMLGDVSWLDEHFDGFMPVEYSLDSIVYEVSGVAVSELSISDTTHVTIEINSVNNLFSSGNTNFIVNLFKLPINDSEYKNTLTDLFTNYVFDQAFQKIGSAAVSGINAIMTNVEGTIVSNKLHIEFDVDYTTAQRLLIADRQYIISVITDDHTTTHATSKRVNVLCDYNDFGEEEENSSLVTDILTPSVGYPTAKFWEHPYDSTIANTGTKNYRGWITDGIYCEMPFKVVSPGILNYITIRVRAINSVTADSFELMTYNIDLAPYPIISGIRIASLSTTRGFKLISGSLRNIVSLNNITPGTATYLLKFALKLRWEDWIQLITAHSDFFDASLMNNGLSHKWSNYYDTVAGWDLFIEQIITAEDSSTGIETDFNIQSVLNSHNYAEDGNTPPLWTVALETFEGATSLGTGNNAKLSNTTDTKIVATFTSFNTILTTDIYGVIYIGKYLQDGIFTQNQLSSVELPASNNWLKPVTGQTKAKVTVVDAYNITVECMTDYTKVVGDVTIMARIGYACQDVAEVRAYDNNLTKGVGYGITYTRSFDLTINSAIIVTGYAVAAPYSITEILAALLAASVGYQWGVVTVNNVLCQAPVGTGSSANGDVVELTIYNSMGSIIDTYTWTLANGVDAFTCPDYVIESFKILQETTDKLLQENGDFLILDL